MLFRSPYFLSFVLQLSTISKPFSMDLLLNYFSFKIYTQTFSIYEVNIATSSLLATCLKLRSNLALLKTTPILQAFMVESIDSASFRITSYFTMSESVLLLISRSADFCFSTMTTLHDMKIFPDLPR